MPLRTIAKPADRHTHQPNGAAADARCRYCGQIISGEIEARIERAEKVRFAEIETAIKTQFVREQQRAQAKMRGEIEKARREGARAAEATITARIAAEREAGAKLVAAAVAAERLTHAGEKLRLEQELEGLQRRLAAKTPHALGEPMEAALYEALAGEFTEDRCVINRVAKGRAGPDITIDVIDQNKTVSCIAIECKNHRRWSNGFITKIKSDARALSTNWCILASNVFPKGATTGLAVVSGVIVCEGRLVIPLVELLRRQIILLHRQRLTTQARDAKGAALLAFIASSNCADLLGEFAKIGESLLALDQREISAHETVWRRRGDLIRSLQAAYTDFSAAVDAIMNGEPASEEEEASV